MPTRPVLPSEAEQLPAVSSSFLAAVLGFLPADIEISLSGRVTGFLQTIISGRSPGNLTNPEIRMRFGVIHGFAAETARSQPDLGASGG
jgi:hypothetical protein